MGSKVNILFVHAQGDGLGNSNHKVQRAVCMDILYVLRHNKTVMISVGDCTMYSWLIVAPRLCVDVLWFQC